jgi:hypothetical protein
MSRVVADAADGNKAAELALVVNVHRLRTGIAATTGTLGRTSRSPVRSAASCDSSAPAASAPRGWNRRPSVENSALT